MNQTTQPPEQAEPMTAEVHPWWALVDEAEARGSFNKADENVWFDTHRCVVGSAVKENGWSLIPGGATISHRALNAMRDNDFNAMRECIRDACALASQHRGEVVA